MNEGKRGQTRSIFTYDPNLKVPDTVGMHQYQEILFMYRIILLIFL